MVEARLREATLQRSPDGISDSSRDKDIGGSTEGGLGPVERFAGPCCRFATVTIFE